MKFSILEYLEEEQQREIEKAEQEAYENEWWYYNPHEDAGDRV